MAEEKKSLGQKIMEKIDPNREESYWRNQHGKQWWGRGKTYDDYSGAYKSGYSGYDRWGRQGRTFEESESEMRADYEKQPGAQKLPWSDAREAARAAWHKVHGNWERLVDYEVQDAANSKIGTVQNLWIDENGQPTFLGVKTGWLGMGKNHVVPVSTATVNDRQRIIRVPYSEDKIKDAPSFDAESDLSDADDRIIYAYYGMTVTGGIARGQQAQQAQPHPPIIGQSQTQTRRQAPATAGREQERTTIPLSEEQVRVGKREVEAGGVRLRKVIRTEVVNQPVELRREEVVIERVPASGAQGTAEAGVRAFQEEDVFIPLRREEAVVQKEARVREEVQVRKGTTTEQQQVSEQVRKEDVEIEKQGEARYETESGKPRQGTPRYEPKERSRR